MNIPNYTLLYVDDPVASATFYERVLGLAPVDVSPTFVPFVLPNGTKLGLWSKHTVAPRPAAGAGPGMTELGFALADHAALDALHADWAAADVTIIEPPTTHDFGRAFTALDPDGHRLRAFVLAPDPR